MRLEQEGARNAYRISVEKCLKEFKFEARDANDRVPLKRSYGDICESGRRIELTVFNAGL
jgi:hypothetical protein